MIESNPYAPPKSFVADVKQVTGCRREGKFVVIPEGSDLPPRCIICNDAVTLPVKTSKIYWHTPWLYLLLVNIIVFAITALVARKSFAVSPGLCVPHASIRRRRLGGGLLAGAAVGLVGGTLMLMCDAVPGGLIAFGLAFVLLVVAGFTSRKVYPKNITKEYARIGGCKEPFLASLE